jgi:hypothetical protein
MPSGLEGSRKLAATVMAKKSRFFRWFFYGCCSWMDSKLDSKPDRIAQVVDFKGRE